jgi:hypothetical protein
MYTVAVFGDFPPRVLDARREAATPTLAAMAALAAHLPHRRIVSPLAVATTGHPAPCHYFAVAAAPAAPDMIVTVKLAQSNVL